MSFFAKSANGLLCLIALAAFGCGKSAPTDAAKGSFDGAPDATVGVTEGAADKEKKKIIPVRQGVKSFDGNWVMVVTSLARDNYAWIVRFTKDADGKMQGEIIDSSNDALKPQIAETIVNDQSMRMVVKNERAKVDFRGTFDGMAIRGTLANGPQEMYLARLLPTSESRLEKYLDSALPPKADVFQKAIQEMGKTPQPKMLVALAREHRTTPMALETLSALLAMQSKLPMDDATVAEIIAEYLNTAKLWGPRMHAQAEFAVAQHMISARLSPAEAVRHLDEAEKLLTDDLQALKPRIEIFRETAEVQMSLDKLKSTSAIDREAAGVELQNALKKQRYNAEILQALAEHAEKMKQRDAAIGYYSDIVALPLLEHMVMARRAGQPPGDPTPTEALKKLWTEKHGNVDALDAHLAEVYRRETGELVTQIRESAPPLPPADAGDHVVLLEFFTGAQMPACVAPEIAIDALAQSLPRTKLVALRFHQHIPGPDGLANQDSEDRFAFYELGRTPTVAIDGLAISSDQIPYGGFLQGSGNAFASLRRFVDVRLKVSTTVRLELEAGVTNGELTIHASATGATEEQLPSLRLRLALAEELVEAPLPNGIRRHELLVREMPGGAKGISPKKGELKYSYTMPLADLQKHLDEYLSRYEAGKKIAIPPFAKPAVRGPLFLVGWVQNDKFTENHPELGRQILQTAIVPIAGSVIESEHKSAPPVPGANPSDVSKTGSSASGDAATPPPPALPE
jgi:hypothetical protein